MIKACLNGNGKISVTSTSKTKKITPTKKNFIQKGRRVLLVESNPHSKGLNFSLSGPDLYVKVLIIIRIIVIEMQTMKYLTMFNI